MAGPFGSDPFGPFMASRQPAAAAPSVLDDVRGTEVDPDPFSAFLAHRSRTAGMEKFDTAPRRAIEYAMEGTPLQDYGGQQLEDFLVNKGMGRSAAFVEGVARQMTPVNMAMIGTSAARGAMEAPSLLRAGAEAVVPASPGAARSIAMQELLRHADVGLGGLQVGEGAAATKDAIQRGDTKDALLSGGMTALGAMGVAAGMRPTRGRVIGEVLPAERGAPAPNDVLPADIDVRPRITDERRMLESPAIDQAPAGRYDDPIERFLQGREEPKRLYAPGLSEADLPPGSGPAEPVFSQGTQTKPAEAPLETQASTQSLATERARLKREGYPDPLIDTLLEKFVSGEGAPVQQPGEPIAPTWDVNAAPPLEERMAADKARRAARDASLQPPTSNPLPARAEFAFRQPDFEGGPDLEMFNIVGGDRDKSTVTANTLRELGIDVPEVPPVQPPTVLPAGTLDRLRELGYSEDRLRGMPIEQANAILRSNERRGPQRVQTSEEDALYARMRDKMARGERTGSEQLRQDFATRQAAERSRLEAADARGETPLPRTSAEGVDSPDAALEGLLARDGAAERPSADGGRLGPGSGDLDRPVRGRAGQRPPAAVGDLVEQLIADARQQGFRGSDDDLRTLLNGEVSSGSDYLSDLAATRDEYGPQAMLSAIRKLGGIRPYDKDYTPGAPVQKMRGEFQTMVEGFKANHGQSGASSIFRDKGLAIDDLVQQLQQDPRWKDLDDRELIDRLQRLAAGVKENGYDLPALEGVLRGASKIERGQPWWKGRVNEPVEDLLDTGETQPRLPGDAGAVRDTEVATPRETAPFSLEREAATRTAVQPRLGEEAAASGSPVESDLESILARHDVRDPEKVTALATSMRENGWQGRPALVVSKDGVQVAWTATHRLEAARQAGLAAKDVPMVHVDGAALERAGYDLDELTNAGKKERIAALRASGQEEAARLLEDERQGSPARMNAPAGAANVDRVPPNVYDFVTRQLGWTREDLAKLSPADIYKLGREKTRNPDAPARAVKPAPVVTRPEGESYNPEALGSIDSDLERFLSEDVPKREARAAARREQLIARQGVPADRVNQPDTRQLPAPITPRDAIATRDAVRANASQDARDAAASAARKAETPSQRQSRVATIQSTQRAAAKEMAGAFQRGDYKRFSDLVGEAAERFWNRQRKMGTGEPGVRRDDFGDILEGGILPGFSMLGKVARDPKKYAQLAGEMLRNPGVRALVGAAAGYASGNTPEEALNRALQGAALAAMAPSGLRALKKAFLLARDGHAPLPYKDPKSTDISMWRCSTRRRRSAPSRSCSHEAQGMLDRLQKSTPARARRRPRS
jgi:hypothetical protein